MSDFRELAVIMFTDIVGYTAMMQDNEREALILLNRFKDELTTGVKESDGNIIQYFGDGALVIFNNSVDAAFCARNLQENLQKSPKVPVRIGIHMGDIIHKEGNIFGNCVNVTSRIESMGIPGSVLISQPVQMQLKNKPEFSLVSMGKFEFKNVLEPMEIFSLTIKNARPVNRADLNGKTKAVVIKSIAVLPFVNMSNDPEQEYFSDGMAEEIINSISHLKDLNVAGRTSSFQFKGKNLDLRQIGKKLNVSYVLEGSVRKQGDRLRITGQLVNVDDGYHIWSEKFDRQINDVFAIQDEIALAITEKLLDSLLKKDRDLITKTYTINTEAYELYLKGRFYLARRGASLLTSIVCFEKSIETDPGFALAYAGAAEAYLLLATYGLIHPLKIIDKAKNAADKAMQLDPTIWQPYATLGYYYTCFDYNWEAGKENFLKSLSINPKYAEGHFRYGWTYLACVEGDFQEAEKHGKESVLLEPLSSICHANYGLILQSAGKFSEALAVCKTGIDLDANSFVCHLNAATAMSAMGQYTEAIASFENAMKLSNRHPFAMNALIWTYCANEEPDKAKILMNELKERSNKEYVGKAITGVSAAYLGNLDESIEYLEKAYLDKDPMLLLLKYEHWVPSNLKNDIRFRDILERIGFPVFTTGIS